MHVLPIVVCEAAVAGHVVLGVGVSGQDDEGQELGRGSELSGDLLRGEDVVVVPHLLVPLQAGEGVLVEVGTKGLLVVGHVTLAYARRPIVGR